MKEKKGQGNKMLTKVVVCSVLILIVLAIRALFQKRVSPIFIYALWLIVAVRLLMPGMLFFSPISIMNTNVWRMGSNLLAQEEERQDREYKQQQYRAYYEKIFKERNTAIENNTGDKEKTVEVEEIELKWQWAGTLFGRIRQLAEIVWVAGMTVTTIIFLWKNLSFYYFLRLSRRKLTKAAAGRRKIQVFLVRDNLTSPCLFGVFPSIYIPEKSTCLKEENFDCILEHELNHYRQKDHLWAFLRMICLIVNWYNPLVWLSAKLSIQDGELACDARCVKKLGESKRCLYGDVILALAANSEEREGAFQTAPMMTSGKKFMKKRIGSISGRQKNNIFVLTIMVIIMLLSIGCTYTGTVRLEENKEEQDSNWTETSSGQEHIR